MGMNRGLIRALSLAFLAGGAAVAFTYRNELDATALATWVAGAGAVAPLLFIMALAVPMVLLIEST